MCGQYKATSNIQIISSSNLVPWWFQVLLHLQRKSSTSQSNHDNLYARNEIVNDAECVVWTSIVYLEYIQPAAVKNNLIFTMFCWDLVECV